MPQRQLPTGWYVLNVLLSGSLFCCFLALCCSEQLLQSLPDSSSSPMPDMLATASWARQTPAHSDMQCRALRRDWTHEPPWSLAEWTAQRCPVTSLPSRWGAVDAEQRAVLDALSNTLGSKGIPPLPPAGLLRHPAPGRTEDASSLQAQIRTWTRVRSAASPIGSTLLSASFLLLGLSHLFLGVQVADMPPLRVLVPAQGLDAGRPAVGGAPLSLYVTPFHPLTCSLLIVGCSTLLCVINLTSALWPARFFAHFAVLQSLFFAAELMLTLTLAAASWCTIRPATLSPMVLLRLREQCPVTAPAA